jgi:hypothetical protein
LSGLAGVSEAKPSGRLQRNPERSEGPRAERIAGVRARSEVLSEAKDLPVSGGTRGEAERETAAKYRAQRGTSC